MLNLQLHLQPDTERRLKQVLQWVTDEELFAQNFIAYQVTELNKAILNLRLDLKQFETRYQLLTQDFYQQFQHGLLEDSEDFIVWAGLYEMLEKNEKYLRQLQ